MLVNLVVSLSNIFGLINISNELSFGMKLLILNVVFASFLMHMSETKHNLKGIYPFNIYSSAFLWYDRIIAYLASLVIIYKIHNDFIIHFGYYNYNSIIQYIFYSTNTLFHQIKYYGIVSLIVLGISENINWIGQYGFMITHSLWHILAFTIMNKTFFYKY